MSATVTSLCQRRRPELSDATIDACMMWAHSEPLRAAHRFSMQHHLDRLREEGYPDDFLEFYRAVAERFLEDDAEFAAHLRSIAQRYGYVPPLRPEPDEVA